MIPSAYSKHVTVSVFATKQKEDEEKNGNYNVVIKKKQFATPLPWRSVVKKSMMNISKPLKKKKISGTQGTTP